MFRPNSTGTLYRVTGRDVHGRDSLAAGVEIPFAPVNMDVQDLKTSVRADSSASRGSAEQQVSKTVILVPHFVEIGSGDQFEFDGERFRISSVHRRRAVSGLLDHIQCGLEMFP